jgi:hypothetical protein
MKLRFSSPGKLFGGSRQIYRRQGRKLSDALQTLGDVGFTLLHDIPCGLEERVTTKVVKCLTSGGGTCPL